jgi:hypothetical protein
MTSDRGGEPQKRSQTPTATILQEIRSEVERQAEETRRKEIAIRERLLSLLEVDLDEAVQSAVEKLKSP